MDNIVNYFVLAFIFVFDPLAVLLLISANKAFKLREDETMNNKKEFDHLKDWVDIKEEQMKDTAFRDFQKQQDENDKKFEDEKNTEPPEDIYKEKQVEQKPPERKRNAYWT
jgi:formylmethanofuran dehydrogenase subunit E